MFAVASSNNTILVFLKIARQIDISYFSPVDKLAPLSFISKLRPALLSLFSNSLSWALSKILSKSASDLSLKGSRLNFRLPLKRTASYGIIVMFFLRSLRPI